MRVAYFHVRLTPTGQKKLSGDELALDLSQEQLEERFLAPRREGRPITVRGRTYEWDDIERIAVNETEESSEVSWADCSRKPTETPWSRHMRWRCSRAAL